MRNESTADFDDESFWMSREQQLKEYNEAQAAWVKLSNFVRGEARGRQIHRLFIQKYERKVDYGFTLRDGDNGIRGIFVKSKHDSGISQEADIQAGDQILAINLMPMERGMTVFKVNRLLANLFGTIDLVLARGEYIMPEDLSGLKNYNQSGDDDQDDGVVADPEDDDQMGDISPSTQKRRGANKRVSTIAEEDGEFRERDGDSLRSKRTESMRTGLDSNLGSVRRKSKKGKSRKSLRSKKSRQSRASSMQSYAITQSVASSRLGSSETESGSSSEYETTTGSDDEDAYSETTAGTSAIRKMRSGRTSVKTLDGPPGTPTPTTTTNSSNNNSQNNFLKKPRVHPELNHQKPLVAPTVDNIQNTDTENTVYCLTCFKHVKPVKEDGSTTLERIFCCLKKSSSITTLCPNCDSLI